MRFMPVVGSTRTIVVTRPEKDMNADGTHLLAIAILANELILYKLATETFVHAELVSPVLRTVFSQS